MMYRLMYLFALFCAVTARGNCPFRHEHDHGKFGHTKVYHNTLFEELSNEVIALDRKVKNYCTQNSNGSTKEVIDADSYKLLVPLDNLKANEVEVKIRHKVLYIKTNKPGKKYSEIRVLPSFVDTKQASYTLSEDELTITIKNQIGVTDSCSTNVNDDIITVQKDDEENFVFGTERMGSF